MGKLKQDKVLTAIVGSYPKPKYVFTGSGRALLDSVGMAFSAPKQRLDRATLMAIGDQNRAGIDIETDGEERRGHYVLYVLKQLAGFDFKHLKRVEIRGGVYQRDVPVVVGPVGYKRSILVRDFKFTRSYVKNLPKIGLPGPSTVVDCVADEYYGNLEKLAYAYAKAIRHEVEALIKTGCRIIQFDDPVLLRYPDRARVWGLKALQDCFQGFEDQATYIVHICCGYPNKPLERKGIKYKANSDYYKDVLSWLSKSSLDVVSIEGAQSKLDVSVLPAIGKKTVMLGVLDVGSNRVETVKSLVTRGREALKYLPAEQLILGPDCGMLQLKRQSALAKLKHMSRAARILNGD